MKKAFARLHIVLTVGVVVTAVFFSGCSKHHNPTPNAPNPIIGLKATVTTFAGNGDVGSVDGTGLQTEFCAPIAITCDANGNLFVLDAGLPTVRKITPDGTVTTYAGTGNKGNGVGPALSSAFDTPQAITIDPSENVYISDQSGSIIKKITPSGTVSIVNAHAAGSGTAFPFTSVNALTSDAGGNIYIVDYKVIRKMTPDGTVTTFLSNPSLAPLGGIVFDKSGNLYTTNGNTVIKVSQQGVITQLAGSGAQGSADGTGTAATFFDPSSIALDDNDNLYVTDSQNGLIRMVSQAGGVGTLAGDGERSTGDGVGTNASFAVPDGIVRTPSGDFYVVDIYANVVRKMVVTKAN